MSFSMLQSALPCTQWPMWRTAIPSSPSVSIVSRRALAPIRRVRDAVEHARG